MEVFFSLALFASVCLVLMAGYPVAFTLAGVALFWAMIGLFTGHFDGAFLAAVPNRLYGIMSNQTLMAVPLFVFMGVMLERSNIAQNLLETMAALFGKRRGGLTYAVLIVGMLMAASTGIVGATVVTMGLLSLPTMLKRGYDPAISSGIICASGTLGQIIPPSIVLVLLGDVVSNAYQQAQLQMGIYAPKTVSVADLFVGALIPGLLLVGLYFAYLYVYAIRNPEKVPPLDTTESVSWLRLVSGLVPPLLLILFVLGSIMGGVATPTEAASVGAVGSIGLAAMYGRFSIDTLRQVMQRTVKITSMVFFILVGASVFSLVFRGFGGDDVVQTFLSDLPGGVITAMFMVMLVMFLLGFVLDFIEITFVVVPIVGPVLLSMGLDPIWLGIMIAVNLQTSFLTPPFGFALFYLRGVAPESVETSDIFKGAIPFIGIQVLVMLLLAVFPALVTWLPGLVS